MIAHIIPIKRLPKQFDLFDYTVPEEFVAQIAVGQLVVIPFRTSTLYGLVFSLDEASQTPANKIKPIESIVSPTPFLSPAQLGFIQKISQLYGTSMATIATMCLLPMQKRKLSKLELEPLKVEEHKELPTHITAHSNISPATYTDTLKQLIRGTTLILVPSMKRLEQVQALFTEDEQSSITLWHSSLGKKDQFARWVEVRNGKSSIIIGTRGAVFLPFVSLDTIIIDNEHDGGHKHHDQAPRFSTKDVSDILAKQHGAAIHLLSFSASAETYYGVHRKDWEHTQDWQPTAYEHDIEIANMRYERRGGNYSAISEKVEELMTHTTGDMFFFINRLGFATSIGCNNCGHVEICEQSGLPFVYHEEDRTMRCHYAGVVRRAPSSCSKCNSSVVALRGVGTEQVESRIRQLMRERDTHNIIRIDRMTDVQLPASEKPRIIIGTQKALPYIRWEQTDLMCYVDIDKELMLPEYRAQELVWHLIHTMQYYRNEESTFVIQTFDPSHLVLRSLKEPDRFYRTDLGMRRALGYPPYTYLARYFYGHANKEVAKREVEKAHRVLQETLTNAGKSVRLSHPLQMHPRYYRGKFWYTVLATFSASSWQADLIWLNSIIPGSWKIDPRPNKILSP